MAKKDCSVVTFYCPNNIVHKLDLLAALQGKPRSQMLRDICEVYTEGRSANQLEVQVWEKIRKLSVQNEESKP